MAFSLPCRAGPGCGFGRAFVLRLCGLRFCRLGSFDLPCAWRLRFRRPGRVAAKRIIVRGLCRNHHQGQQGQENRHEHQSARHGKPPLSVDGNRRRGLSLRGVPAAAENRERPDSRYYAFAGNDCKAGVFGLSYKYHDGKLSGSAAAISKEPGIPRQQSDGLAIIGFGATVGWAELNPRKG